MTTIPFDTLKFVERLEAGGFTSAQAKAAAQAFAEATSQELASKADIAVLRSEMQSLRSEMQSSFQILEQKMTIKLGGLIVVAVGALLAGMRYLPGH